MAKIMSLDGAGGLGAPKQAERCKCVRNSRTGKRTKLCFVGRDKTKNRSGWTFVKGGC